MQKCSRILQLAAPPVLAQAVKEAADRELLTISEYIRRTLIDRLRADGVDPTAIDGAAQRKRSHKSDASAAAAAVA